MARSHARIKTAIWSDDHFTALCSGPQRLYHLILEQPTLSMCGVVALTVGRWSLMAKDTTQRSINSHLKALEDERFLLVDRGTEEVWVRSFAKHDIQFAIPNSVVAMTNDFAAIRSSQIRDGFIDSLPLEFVNRYPEGLPDGLAERLSQPFRCAMEVRK